MRAEERGVARPEEFISSLIARLRSQALYDALLICTPPFLVVLYATAATHRLALLSPSLLFGVVGLSLGFLGLAGLLIYRPQVPSAPLAARLLDEKTEARDRFMTLATLDPRGSSPVLMSRLRLEAGGFARRLSLERDFPYKVKPRFYQSLLASAVAALLLYLFLPVAQSSTQSVGAAAHERLRELAREMAVRPRLVDLGRRLEALVKKLEDRTTPNQQQQKLVQEMRQKVEEQQKKEPEQGDKNILGQTSSTLKSLEQQSGAGQEQSQEKNQGGGGSIQSNLPQEGKGESQQSQGSGSDPNGQKTAELNSQIQQGNSAQGDPKGQTGAKNQQSKGNDKSEQGNPDIQQGPKSNETAGKNEGKSEQPGGKNPASEERPQGNPPADRFGGDGKGGLKGEHYVTVQLPDDPTADPRGDAKTGNAKGGRSRTTLPASNVPLPAHVPDAPTEVQQMPLEYRGLIR
jgi:hypothetical protein